MTKRAKIPKHLKERVLNAVATELVADQVRRALELGFEPTDIELGVMRGMGHGLAEFQQGQNIRNYRKREQ